MWREQRRCPIQQKTSQPIAHLGQSDGDFEFGALGLGVSGTGRIGAVVELADQFHRAVQGMEAAIAVIADVHHASTDRAVAVKDVEFPQSEIRILGPLVRHPADLRDHEPSVDSETSSDVTSETHGVQPFAGALVFSRPPGACGGRAPARRRRAWAFASPSVQHCSLRWILLEGLPAVVGGRSDAGLAAGLVDVQAGVEVGLDVAEDRGDPVRSGSFSHGSLPGSLPVVRFPLRLDQVLGGRPERKWKRATTTAPLLDSTPFSQGKLN